VFHPSGGAILEEKAAFTRIQSKSAEALIKDFQPQTMRNKFQFYINYRLRYFVIEELMD
jgi:hypothetical protein